MFSDEKLALSLFAMPHASESPSSLIRHLGALQATALNMSNMVGVGPFITIPLLMSAMGGPQALLGWLIAVLIVIPDGLVWSELGAAMPGSGGSYVYLREGFGREKFGRLAAFLFIWQFILSGPLEIASGYIGFVDYLGYIWKGMTPTNRGIVIIGIGLLNIALLYRRITHIGKLTVLLWIGMMITVAVVIVSGAINFNFSRAFNFPPDAFQFSVGFFLGMGAATRVGIYDYLGYYDICYLVQNHKRFFDSFQMCENQCHEKRPDLRAFPDGNRTPAIACRAAGDACLHVAPLPDSLGQCCRPDAAPACPAVRLQ